MSDQTPEPSHEEIQELLGVYALDAVDAETAAMVERHLEGCVRCSTEVAQHHEVAGLLANSGGESPPGLWDGIASHLDGSVPPSWERLAGRLDAGDSRPERVIPPTGPPGPTPEGADIVPITTGTSRNRWVARGAALVAAAAALVAIGLGVQVHHLDNRVSALQGPSSLSAAERAALTSPSTKQVRLSVPVGSGASTSQPVTVVLTAAGTGFVEGNGLSALPDDKTYQLWGVIGGKTISLGLLGSTPSVVPFSVAGHANVDAFAITAEHAGGVVHSLNQPVVAGEVSA